MEDYLKMLPEDLDDETAIRRIEKERQNKASSNAVTPAKANDYDNYEWL